MAFVVDPNHPSNWNRDERNLYVRTFAGFLFASHGGPSEPAEVLFNCANRLADDAALAPALTRVPRPAGDLVVSFDNNLHDAARSVRHGPEYGDVVIWGDNGFVTVEAKCNTDWSFEKDVAACFRSAAEVEGSTGKRHLAHVLLVAETKWLQVRQPHALNHSRSQYRRLVAWLQSDSPSLCVVTWEQIARTSRDVLGNAAGSFPDWLELQVDICLRTSDEMPPY